MSARALRRFAVAGAAGAAVLLALPTAAGAHVNARGETVDGTTTVTFTFDHGCDGNPTTSLRVQLPEGATNVEPQDPAGWTSTVSDDELAWTGGEIASGQLGTFVVTMTLVDPEGTTVFLPTVQACTGGTEEAWIDRSDDPGADAAAPRITAGAVVAVAPPTTAHDSGTFGDHETEPEGSAPADEAAPTGAAPTTTVADDHGESASPATEDASHSSSSNTGMIIAIIAAVAIIGAIIAFVVTRRGSSTASS